MKKKPEFPPVEIPRYWDSGERAETVAGLGDRTWQIARRTSGRGSDWYRIWLANRETIPDFDVLRAGLSLKVPSENSGLKGRKGM
mgnify:CR=1 FL=1